MIKSKPEEFDVRCPFYRFLKIYSGIALSWKSACANGTEANNV